jgi:putative nucleotidyltransferase with HDIG domain
MEPIIPSSETDYIPVGEFRIATGKKLIALLGSCVGVALYDRSAHIGGVLHIALPEPISSIPAQDRMAYASTGLPLFIKELLAKGARADRLEAVVAGGALTLPVSQADINLDLGGRTADTVLDILAREKIPVVHSDTGGYHGCSLLLDTADWATEITPTIPIATEQQHPFTTPNGAAITKAIQKIRPIPQIALKVIRLIHEHDYNMAQLSEEIRSDQVICARIIQFCNSPLYGFGRYKIDSIDRALTFFGEQNLLSLMISACVNIYFVYKEGGYSLRRGGLFTHAIGVANATKKIAGYITDIPPELAYTAGLLHDIGKVVLDQFVAEARPLFYKGMHGGSRSFSELEQQILGTNHLAVGMRLAESWSLPANIVEAIGLHDDPEKTKTAPRLVHAVHLANLLTSWYIAGMELERLTTDKFKFSLDRLGLRNSQLEAIITSLSGRPALR